MKKCISFLFLLFTQLTIANPTIVNYKPLHHDQVVNIIYEEPFLILPGEEWVESGRITMDKFREKSQERLEEAFASSDCIKKVISINNEIYGFVSYVQFQNKIYLDCIAISKKVRGQGLGTLLINYVIADAKKMNCKSITLEVNKSNKRAQKFYTKNGFNLSASSDFAKEFKLVCYKKDMTFLEKLRTKLIRWQKPLYIGAAVITYLAITKIFSNKIV